MKNKLIRIVSLLICLILSFTVIGCEKEDQQKSSSQNKQDPNHFLELSVSEEYFFLNGSSDYAIIKPNSSDYYTETALEEINTLIKLSTGKTLPIVDGNGLIYSRDAKYISIGQNDYLKSSMLNLGGDRLDTGAGFEIKTEGNSVFIVGGSSLGNLYGVYNFLYYQLGIETFAIDEIAYNKVDTVNLVDIYVKEQPDFSLARISYYAETVFGGNASNILAYRMGLQKLEDAAVVPNGETHTSFFLLPPSVYYAEHKNWYNDAQTQLCYSRDVEGLINELMPKIKEYLLDNPVATLVNITHEDGQTWCDCTSCNNLERQYGAESASQLLFINEFAKQLNKYMAAPSGDPSGSYTDDYMARYGVPGNPNRQLYVMMFAYVRTLQCPTKINRADLEDNLIVQIAPISANFGFSLDNTKYNKGVKTLFENWSKLTKLAYWGYSLSEWSAFYPLNCLGSFQSTYQFINKVGTLGCFQEGQSGTKNCPDWRVLELYLSAKLMWNTHSDVNLLIDKFFDNYYGPAAEEMKKTFYDEQDYKVYLAEVLLRSGYSGDGTIGNTEYWPQSLLLNYIERINNVDQTLTELYKTDAVRAETLSKRVKRETIPFRYLLLKNYKSLYHEKTFEEMKQSLISDALSWGVTSPNGYTKTEDLLKAL